MRVCLKHRFSVLTRELLNDKSDQHIQANICIRRMSQISLAINLQGHEYYRCECSKSLLDKPDMFYTLLCETNVSQPQLSKRGTSE